MRCKLCILITRIFINFLYLSDCFLNTLLGGSPRETISVRAAKARIAGNPFMHDFCKILSWGATIVSLGIYKGDHCTYALDDNLPSHARELWHWDKVKSLPESIDFLFMQHPKSVNESYLEHAQFALTISLKLFIASLTALIHAILPCVFITATSDRIKEIIRLMQIRLLKAALAESDITNEQTL